MFKLTGSSSSAKGKDEGQKVSSKTKASQLSAGALRCRRKFLKFFPQGFRDPKYISWERGYKWNAHEAWEEQLGRAEFHALLKSGEYKEIALRAVRIESRTNLLFSFEKMALRDAVKSHAGAKIFATGLFELLYGSASLERRFTRWIEAVESLPRKQTRALTWPLVTVFAFLAQPEIHFFLKPMVTRRAADYYGYEFNYVSRPNWETYDELLTFAAAVRRDQKELKPKDMIDVQSFLWVQGSDEYE